MSLLLIGEDAAVAAWVASKIPHVSAFGHCRAIGVTIDPAGHGERLVAGCVYHNYIRDYGVCEISFASVWPGWATKPTIRALLSVPFDQYTCRKVYLQIPNDNAAALRFCAGIGFKREATLKHHYAQDRHGVVMSMLRDEWAQTWRIGRVRPEWHRRAVHKETANG